MIMHQPSVLSVNGNVPAWLAQNAEAATITTFEKICRQTVASGVSIDEIGHYDGLIGNISFVGDITWSLVLGLPHYSAEAIAKKFVGCEVSFDSPDMGEIVAELTNILAGVLCGQVENEGFKAQMSLPTVARGSDFELLLSDKFYSQKLNFKTADNNFFWIKIIVAKH